MKIDLKNLTIEKVQEHFARNDFTAVELAEAYRAEIEKKNPELNAYLEVYDDVLEQAKHADEMLAAGKGTALTGVPISIKDNILVKGKVVSSASKMLEDYRATYDATVVKKLKAAGAVILGRTNMDEFAMGGSTENSAFGAVKNPWDTSRVPGGSSGGAAAAVAADLCVVSLGSDTGGSIRQPASFTGMVGLKPTYGAVSRYGLMAMASSLDQIGPIAKNVSDAETVFTIIKGKDRMDSTSVDIEAGEAPKTIRIGVPRGFLKQGVDADVMENFEKSVEALRRFGCEVKDVELPSLPYSLAVYYVLMPAEVSSNLARYDGIKYGLHKEGNNLLDEYLLTRHEGFGPEVRRRIMLGTYVLSTGYYDAYYNKANIVRRTIMKDFEEAFKDVDLILTPTSPTPAFRIGEKSNDPLAMYLADIFTVSANIASVPALSVPSGFAEREGKRLPLGIQFTAPYGRDDLLFVIGRKFEQARV